MSINRRAAKRDANERPIIEALEAVGASVEQAGFCDLIVGYRGDNYLLEVKGKRGRLQASQRRLLDEWRGQYAIVRTIDEALKVIGATD